MTVRNRDGGRCRGCGSAEGGQQLSVHHIVPASQVPEELDAHLPVNLVSLCRACHSKFESKLVNKQLRLLQLESREELMITDGERENLNERLEYIGPDSLTIKKVKKDESIAFLNQGVSGAESQTDLSEYQ